LIYRILLTGKNIVSEKVLSYISRQRKVKKYCSGRLQPSIVSVKETGDLKVSATLKRKTKKYKEV
jgi:hypothetical protein